MSGMIVRHYGMGEWGITAPGYSPTLRALAKETPGMRWEPSAKAWIGYVDAVALVAERLKAARIRVDYIDTPNAKVTTTTAVIATKGLRDYQVEGVSFLIANGPTGALLADDMGLGKTATCLRAGRSIKKDMVVVCPSFVRSVWQREAVKWWPDATVTLLSGTKPKETELRGDPARPALFVIHYDVIHAWAPLLIEGLTGFISAFDEGHYLQSDKSRRSKACRDLARAAAYRFILTGTPMTSRPRDLWNVVDTISEDRFGKPFPFYLRYCDAHKEEVAKDRIVWKTDGASHLDELQRRMQFFMLRRTKTDVKLELPPRTRQVIEVSVPKSCTVMPMTAMKNDQALRKALDLAADGKLPEVVSMIESHATDDHSVVVFCHRRAVAEIITDSLIGNGIDVRFVHGGVPQKERDKRIAMHPQVLVCTLDTTAVGIDLSHYDVAVFAELDWVPSKLLQGEARLHRFGQKKNVLIQYVIASGSVDEIIQRVCIDKLDTFEQTIGKLDDGLKKDLNGAADVSTAQQLKSLYEKLLAENA